MNDVAQRTRRMLTQPVDNTFLVYFRVAFGSLLVWSLVKYFQTDLIRTQFIEPRICFSFYGFDWVKPWAGVGMYAHFLVTAIAAACIMVGFKHRLSSTIFFPDVYVHLFTRPKRVSQPLLFDFSAGISVDRVPRTKCIFD